MSEGVIGIDAGGTRCRLAFACAARRTDVILGPANFTSDPARAMVVLRDGLASLASEARIDPRACRIVIGMAGVLDPADGAAVADALGLPHARVTDDRATTLEGALGPGDGAVAALGTGSFFGNRRAGVVRFCGGWGPLLGDEASAHWLGREALRAAARATETGEAGPLVRAVRDRIGKGASLLGFAATSGASGIAALAPAVPDAAPGDPVASDILRRGATHVADGLSRAGWRGDTSVCLVGGAAPAYDGHLTEALKRCLIPARGTALDGALALARAMTP